MGDAQLKINKRNGWKRIVPGAAPLRMPHPPA